MTVVERTNLTELSALIQPMRQLSADPDHLDVYGDVKSFHEGFEAFAERISGTLFLEADAHIVGRHRQAVRRNHFAAGGGSLARGSHRPAHRRRLLDRRCWIGGAGTKARFPSLGAQRENALAAVCLAEATGELWRRVYSGLGVQGIERRFAYHVERITAFTSTTTPTIRGTKRPLRQCGCRGGSQEIFQPHLFTRTRDNLVEFGRALAQRIGFLFHLPSA